MAQPVDRTFAEIAGRWLAAETAARLAAIIQSSRDAVVGKTLNGVITSWNPAAERLYGYTAREMIGHHYDVLIPPENRDEETRFHAALREAIRQMLTRNGYRVLAAASGPEALEILGAHQGPVDVLLTDVVMPQMQGRQLAGKVRAGRPGIRVLFMSGYTQGLLDDQGVTEPGVHLIEKPFDQPALLTKLNEVLRAGT